MMNLSEKKLYIDLSIKDSKESEWTNIFEKSGL